jgi:hypothetical protein
MSCLPLLLHMSFLRLPRLSVPCPLPPLSLSPCACVCTSTAMGAAEVMHILDWSRPRAALTLDRINACAQPKPRGAPPLCTHNTRHAQSTGVRYARGAG